MTVATTSVGRYLLNRLQDHGVTHIFGIPGDYVLRFDKLIEEHPIQFVNTTRENTAGLLADAYARLRGLGVACITYGVGINIVNATSQAYVESSPLVIISGAPGTEEMDPSRTLHHQINPVSAAGLDMTQMDIFRKITVDQAVLSDPATAAASIDRVLSACLRHRKPVYIELPRDRVDTLCPVSMSEQLEEVSDPEALREALAEVTAILRSSRQPILWAGHEVRGRRLAKPMLAFAERHQIPILSTLLGKGVVSEHHPLFVGVYQGGMSLPAVKAIADGCDAVLMFGMIQTDVDTGNFTANLGTTHRIFASPESVTIGHHHFPKVILRDFIEGLAGLNLKRHYPKVRSHWTDRLQEPFELRTNAKITTKRLLDCVQSHLSSDHMIVSDIGDCLFGSADLVVEQDGFLACSLFAAIGFGTPAALGAQLALPHKRVIALVGDGAFQMTATELSTAVYYQLDPVIILLNNHGYGMERPLLKGSYNDIQNWNYAQLPRLLGGGHGVHVTTEGAFDRALTEALNRRGCFSLIEVELGKLDFSPGMKRFGALFGKTI